MELERRFYWAAEAGRVQEVKNFLDGNPTLNVNWRDDHPEEFGFSALLCACHHGYQAMISLLLAHPNIDVNQKDDYENTPFKTVCYRGDTSCVRMLLKDSRVDVNEPDSGRHTPLWSAASNGHVDTIKWWIASGRELNLGTPGDLRTDAILQARTSEGWETENWWNRKAEVATLLERFKENPEGTRHAMRVEVGWYDEMAAEMFALVVFVSDGLLQVALGDQSTPATPAAAAARFFSIAKRLPLELQMVLCHKIVGSAREIIPAIKSETAFKDLAKRI